MYASFEWRDCAFESRLLYIKCPLKSHKLCTIRRARMATLGCAFLCALATIPFLFEHMVVPTPAHEGDGEPGPTMPSAAYAEAGTTYEYTRMAAASVNASVNVSAEGGSTEHEAMYSIDMRSMQPDAGAFARFLGKLVFWMQAMVNKILPTALLCALSVFLVVSMRNAERRRQLLRAPKTSASNLLQTARANSVLNPVLEVQEPTAIEAQENRFGCNGRLDGMGPPGRLGEALSTALRSEANGDACLSAAPLLTPPSMSYAQSSQSQSQVDCALGEASYVERDEDSNVNALTLNAFPFRAVAPAVSFSSAAKAASSTAAGKIIKRNGSHCQSVSGNILDHRCRRTSRTTHLLLAICVIYIIDYIPQVGHLFGTLRTDPILV